jgi:tRNA dimethylallyltransferase
MSESNILRISQLNLPNPLVVIVGATAVGKTEIALQLSERLGGEVISADSRQFYRAMDIGTAKPNASELARVPHHLIDVADPDESWSLAFFQEAATQAVADIHSRGRLPLLVGGTGQYIRAVIEAWEIPAQTADTRLRAALERWASQLGPYGLHQRLALLDPQAAKQIDATNVRRTIRALEVIFHSGRPFSEQRQRSESPYSLLIIGLRRPRPELYTRVDQRIEAMFAAGLVDEVQGLLKKGYSPNLPTLSAIGYREVAAYLRGRMTLEEAKTQMKRFTRRYIRQQSNWFSDKDPTIHWFDLGSSSENQAVEQILALIHNHKAWIMPSKV